MRQTMDETEINAAHTIAKDKWKTQHSSVCAVPILLPFGRYHVFWNFMLLVILMFSLIETPYTIAFVHAPSIYDPAISITLLIDILFLIDVFINFRTAYVDKYDRLRIITAPQSIAKHYLKSWFLIDLISSLPIITVFVYAVLYRDSKVYAGESKYFTIIRLFRLLKLFRISKLLKIFQNIQRKTFSNDTRNFLRLFKIFGFMLLVAHYCACVWFFVGYHSYKSQFVHKSWIDIMIEEQYPDTFDEIANFTKYSYSIYWSVVTLFTTGYGDLHAFNQYEQWTALVCILIGSLFFAYFIGVLTTSLNENAKKRYKNEQIEEALTFCSHYNLPQELREGVMAHIQYFCEYNYTFDEQKVMNALPNDLQKNIQSYLAKAILNGLDIFQSLSQSVIGQIALKLKSKSVNTGHKLFEKGDIGKEIYIQRTGKSKLDNYKELKRGDVCGENVIISHKRMHTVQCETWSEFYVLDVQDIIKVLHTNYNKSTAKKKWSKIKNTVKTIIDRDKVHIDEYPDRKRASIQNEKEEKCNEDQDDEKTITVKYCELFAKPKSEIRNHLVLNEYNQTTQDHILSIPDYSYMERASDSIETSTDTQHSAL